MLAHWEFIDELENEYGVYRKNVMHRFSLSAVEVDTLLFLANNPQYDTAADVVRNKRIPKSHVSLAVKGLAARGFLTRTPDAADRKKTHLAITEAASSAVAFGQQQQQAFILALFRGFSAPEIEQYHAFCRRIMENVHNKRGKYAPWCEEQEAAET